MYLYILSYVKLVQLQIERAYVEVNYEEVELHKSHIYVWKKINKRFPIIRQKFNQCCYCWDIPRIAYSVVQQTLSVCLSQCLSGHHTLAKYKIHIDSWTNGKRAVVESIDEIDDVEPV